MHKKSCHSDFKFYSAHTQLLRNAGQLHEATRRMSDFKNMLKDRYKKKIEELQGVKEELESIYKVTHALKAGMDPKKISLMIARLTCELMHTDACLLQLVDEESKMLIVNAGYRVSEEFMKRFSVVKIGECVNGKAAASGKAIVVSDIDRDHRIKNVDLIKAEGFVSMLSVPILFQDKVSGVISAYSRKKRQFSTEEMEVLGIFASQAAVAIQEARHCRDIQSTYFNTIKALVLAIEAKDPYTRGHTERVTEYALAVGKNLGFNQKELETLQYAGELHDLGKISIPDFVLCKPGTLTCDERAIIERHPQKGTELIGPLEFLKNTIPVVRHHHERYDGRGYPDKLSQDNIPIMARIIACADSYDAMTSNRPYRIGKMSHEQALQEILDNAGSQFDPRIAQVFVETMQTYHNSAEHEV